MRSTLSHTLPLWSILLAAASTQGAPILSAVSALGGLSQTVPAGRDYQAYPPRSERRLVGGSKLATREPLSKRGILDEFEITEQEYDEDKKARELLKGDREQGQKSNAARPPIVSPELASFHDMQRLGAARGRKQEGQPINPPAVKSAREEWAEAGLDYDEFAGLHDFQRHQILSDAMRKKEEGQPTNPPAVKSAHEEWAEAGLDYDEFAGLHDFQRHQILSDAMRKKEEGQPTNPPAVKPAREEWEEAGLDYDEFASLHDFQRSQILSAARSSMQKGKSTHPPGETLESTYYTQHSNQYSGAAREKGQGIKEAKLSREDDEAIKWAKIDQDYNDYRHLHKEDRERQYERAKKRFEERIAASSSKLDGGKPPGQYGRQDAYGNPPRDEPAIRGNLTEWEKIGISEEEWKEALRAQILADARN